MKRSQYLTLLPFVGLALLVVLLPAPFPTTPVTHQVTLTAQQFGFDPPVLHVNRGDRVLITLQAADVVHGFYLDGYNLETRVEPGISQQVEFIAEQGGKFNYHCSVSCGTLHPFMIGKLVVNPNWTFVRVIGLMLIAVAATLFYLWRFPPQLT